MLESQRVQASAYTHIKHYVVYAGYLAQKLPLHRMLLFEHGAAIIHITETRITASAAVYTLHALSLLYKLIKNSTGIEHVTG